MKNISTYAMEYIKNNGSEKWSEHAPELYKMYWNDRNAFSNFCAENGIDINAKEQNAVIENAKGEAVEITDVQAMFNDFEGTRLW